ncbi:MULTISPECIES: tyrosine-type recombinase/integrase [Vibrio harveyi group]|uniref:tyrosine-type recombinase/integrase n=1 Tax=Vibrio harveyi group TaxID=717610 RepID=UPI001C9D3408|nr:site-specific integrase [Vibrio parahaemolyticus]MBY8181328.1 site-specific integrase [Vibrio fluvialis]MCG0026239.1 site-specific integrase [Vibrio parahaemolyticus]
MATISIEPQHLKSGMSYKVRARSGKKDPIKFSMSRTFKKQSQAARFAKNISAQFKEKDFSFLHSRPTVLAVSDALTQFQSYVSADEEMASKYNKNISTVIKRFINSSLADLPIDLITPRDIIHSMREIQETYQLSPSTLGFYLSALSTAFYDANTLLGFNFNTDALRDARPTLKRHGLISRSRPRNRVLSLDELNRITTYYEKMEERGRSSIPMIDIMWFALYVCLRQGEICQKLQWQHYDETTHVLTVDKRKDPTDNKNKITKITLNAATVAIINKMPKGEPSDPIFPFNPKSVSASWTRAMKALGIEDLHFHDLRATGSSELYKYGMDLYGVSKLAGHSSAKMQLTHYLRNIPVVLPQDHIKLN